MQKLWKWIKNITVCIGLGLAAAAVRDRIKLRRMDAAGHRVPGHLDDLGRGVDNLQGGVSQAADDSRELSHKIGSAVSGIKGDLGETGDIARRLRSADQRADRALERLEEANQRFRELIGQGDQEG